LLYPAVLHITMENRKKQLRICFRGGASVATEAPPRKLLGKN